MKTRFVAFFAAVLMALGIASLSVAPAGAVNVFNKGCKGPAQTTAVCASKNENVNPIVQTVIEILLWAIGIISVIMIIVGGIKFVISSGDASQIKSARETIIYALVGLGVALLAYQIVRFVVGRL